ncbi:MAG: DUF5670 family protein [Armatimonadota bacterium]
MLWMIIGLLLALSLLGLFIGQVGGWLVYLLLVIAVIVFVVDLLRGQRVV